MHAILEDAWWALPHLFDLGCCIHRETDRDRQGNTPLHLAACHGEYESMAELGSRQYFLAFDRSALYVRNFTNMTPIDYAFMLEKGETLRAIQGFIGCEALREAAGEYDRKCDMMRARFGKSSREGEKVVDEDDSATEPESECEGFAKQMVEELEILLGCGCGGGGGHEEVFAASEFSHFFGGGALF